MMTIHTKTFEELTKEELYALLELRTAVFVVEQNCPYQEVDGKDQKALHVFGTKDGNIVAYARAFNAGDYFKEASIGRVTVHQDQRKYGYGYDIMNASINAVKEYFNKTVIYLSAQSYLLKFYNSLGFEAVGEEYLEDDIPHIKMVKE